MKLTSIEKQRLPSAKPKRKQGKPRATPSAEELDARKDLACRAVDAVDNDRQRLARLIGLNDYRAIWKWQSGNYRVPVKYLSKLSEIAEQESVQ